VGELDPHGSGDDLIGDAAAYLRRQEGQRRPEPLPARCEQVTRRSGDIRIVMVDGRAQERVDPAHPVGQGSRE
jgi:hypothetical protein